MLDIFLIFFSFYAWLCEAAFIEEETEAMIDKGICPPGSGRAMTVNSALFLFIFH